MTAEALELMPRGDVVAFLRDRPDSAWLEMALSRGCVPEDEGVYWVVLPGDQEIWPVRVVLLTHERERHAVWLSYRWPLGAELWVQTQEGEPVLAPWQAGEAGRVALLRGDDQGSVTPAGG